MPNKTSFCDHLCAVPLGEKNHQISTETLRTGPTNLRYDFLCQSRGPRGFEVNVVRRDPVNADIMLKVGVSDEPEEMVENRRHAPWRRVFGECRRFHYR